MAVLLRIDRNRRSRWRRRNSEFGLLWGQLRLVSEKTRMGRPGVGVYLTVTWRGLGVGRSGALFGTNLFGTKKLGGGNNRHDEIFGLCLQVCCSLEKSRVRYRALFLERRL
jgi:hypothetical protein